MRRWIWRFQRRTRFQREAMEDGNTRRAARIGRVRQRTKGRQQPPDSPENIVASGPIRARLIGGSRSHIASASHAQLPMHHSGLALSAADGAKRDVHSPRGWCADGPYRSEESQTPTLASALH